MTKSAVNFDSHSILREMYKRNHIFCFLKIYEIRYQDVRIYISERDPGPLQTSRTEFFAKVVNS